MINRLAAPAGQYNMRLLQTLNGFVIASFPRSGSTLTRDVISTLVRLDLKARDPSISPTHPAFLATNILPNLTGVPIERPPELASYPLIVRTHESLPIRDFRTVFWFRDPVDSINSYFHLARRRRPELNIVDFCNKVMPLWEELARAALARLTAERNSIHFVRYENYLTDPSATFEAITAFLNLPGRDRTVHAVKKVNAQFHSNARFAPTPDQPERGRAGEGRRLIEPVVRRKIEDRLGADFQALNDLSDYA